MANIPGTNLAAGIVPFTSDDTYPTHYAMYGKGGHRTVQSIVNRNSIPTTLKEEGMTVFVLDDNTKYTWKKNPNNNNVVEWLSDANINAVGTNTQVIFNDNGTLAGDSGLLYNKTTKELTIYQSLELSNTNTKAGKHALLNLASGNNNVAIGRSSLSTGTAQNYNTAIGDGAGYTNSSILNTYIGYNSGRLHTGNHSIFIGSRCGDTETSGDYKLFVESNESRSANKNYLIEGDFSERWVRFNGAVRKRVVNITAPATALITGTVTSYLSDVITDTSKTFVVNAYSDKLLIITAGLGVGKVSKINSNTVNTISLTHTIVCDNTSSYKIIETTNILNENFNSEYLVDLSTEDYFVYFNNFPNWSQEINITINKNPNNKNLWIAAETTNGLNIFPYKVIYRSYNTPLQTHTFKAYQQDVFSRGYLETTQNLKQLQPISTTTKDIQIDLNTEIYKLDVATATTVTLSVDSSYIPILTNNALTIELHINMTSASLMTFPVNVSWIGGIVPGFNAINKYAIVLRTMDAGSNWIANIAYTY